MNVNFTAERAFFAILSFARKLVAPAVFFYFITREAFLPPSIIPSGSALYIEYILESVLALMLITGLIFSYQLGALIEAQRETNRLLRKANQGSESQDD